MSERGKQSDVGKGPWIKGKNIPEEQKKRQSEKMTGRYDGDMNPFHGRRHSEESLKKMRNAEKPRGVKSATSRGWKLLFDGEDMIGRFETLEEIIPIVNSTIHNLKHHVRSKGKSKIGNRFILWYEEDYKKSLE